MCAENHSPGEGVLLSAALQAINVNPGEKAAGMLITGVTQDSRQVQPGSLFVAVPGEITDGHRFIPDAIQRGAVAVVGSRAVEGMPVPYFMTTDSRLALARLSAAFHCYPARRLWVIGVTGTDGKTTTANLLYQILVSAGRKAGMISTVSAVISGEEIDTGFHVTTPDAPQVQALLARMAAAGLEAVVLEATSHGLAQQRVAACDFDVGVVTNITHEHLDYHGSYEAYREAKGRLFMMLADTPEKPIPVRRGAALNFDDSSLAFLDGITRLPKVKYGFGEGADVRGEQVEFLPGGGMRMRVRGLSVDGEPFDFPIYTTMMGQFNLANCLAAVATARGVMGISEQSIQEGIAAMRGVPGRMERVNLGQDFMAIVDFAHTPNALRRALEAARQATEGRVIAAFGSAGLRDRLKRRLMAQVAAELADFTVLTAEDPRTESLEGILAEMASAMTLYGGLEGETFWRVSDRGEAIRFAVSLARPGDLVIVCGKGHEQSMCFGEVEYPWDDRLAMRVALAERLGLTAPQMPYLPTQEKGGL